MKLFIGADHAGYKLKEEVKELLSFWKFDFEDLSPKFVESDDYPDIALKVAEKVVKSKEKGILICGSGQGMNMAANKVPKIRAALCRSSRDAEFSREHNDSNILVLEGWHTHKKDIKPIIASWLRGKFEHGRHERRIDKIRDIEKKYSK